MQCGRKFRRRKRRRCGSNEYNPIECGQWRGSLRCYLSWQLWWRRIDDCWTDFQGLAQLNKSISTNGDAGSTVKRLSKSVIIALDIFALFERNHSTWTNGERVYMREQVPETAVTPTAGQLDNSPLVRTAESRRTLSNRRCFAISIIIQTRPSH